jgi:orotidine-5'-phosphate decarboxylase
VAVLAVTVLTSLDDEALRNTGAIGPVADQVARLAELSLRAGAGGLVCSPLELAALRSLFGPASDGGPVLVTPGIRAEGWATQDQRRTATVHQALGWGADLVVVGRPISDSSDPRGAARAFAKAVEHARTRA